MWAGSGWRTALLTYFTLISPLHSIRRVTIAAGKAFFSISPPQSTTKLSVRGLCSRGREKCYLEIRGCASCRIRAAGRRSNYTVPRCFFFFLYFFFPFFSNSETAPSRCRRNRRISIEEKKKEFVKFLCSFFSFLFFFTIQIESLEEKISRVYNVFREPISLYFPRVVKLVFHRNRSFRGVLPTPV